MYTLDDITRLSQSQILNIIGDEYKNLSLSNLRYPLINHLVQNNLIEKSSLYSDNFWYKISNTNNTDNSYATLTEEIVKIVLLNSNIEVVKLISMTCIKFYNILNDEEFLIQLQSNIDGPKIYNCNEVIINNYSYRVFLSWYEDTYYTNKCLKLYGIGVCFSESLRHGDMITHNNIKDMLELLKYSISSNYTRIVDSPDGIPLESALKLCEILWVSESRDPIIDLIEYKVLDHLNGKDLTQEELDMFDDYYDDNMFSCECSSYALGYTDLFKVLNKYSPEDINLNNTGISYDSDIICKWFSNVIISLRSVGYDEKLIENLFKRIFKKNEYVFNILHRLIQTAIENNINRSIIAELIDHYNSRNRDKIVLNNNIVILNK